MYLTDFQRFIKVNDLRKKEVADFMGVSASFITQLCKGERELPSDKLKQIKANIKWDTSMFSKASATQNITTNNGTAINALGNVEHNTNKSEDASALAALAEQLKAVEEKAAADAAHYQRTIDLLMEELRAAGARNDRLLSLLEKK